MNNRSIVVLAALEMEARALKLECIDVQVIGPRASNLRQEILHDRSCVIMAGLAGALDPALRVGEIVIDGQLELSDAHHGRIHTCDRIVSTPDAKAALFGHTGALAVDMESAIVRLAAGEVGVPFVAIRAICDTADQFVHPAMLGLIDERGHASAASVASFLLRHPNLLPQLFRLRSNAAIALARLSHALKQMSSQLIQTGQ